MPEEDGGTTVAEMSQEDRVLEELGAPETEGVGEPETVVEDVPAPESESTTETTTEEPEFNESLVREALDKGFSEADIKAFGSEDAARKVLTAFDRRMAGLVQQQSQQPIQPQQPQQPIQAQQQQIPEEFKPFELKLDPDVVDQNVIDTLQGMNQHYAQQATAMQQAMGTVLQMNQQQLFDQQVREFDSFVNSLGEEYKDLFGKGSSLDLAPSSTAYMNRDKAFTAALRARDAYASNGIRTPSMTEMFRRGLHMEFGDKMETIARRSVNNRVEKTRARGSHPPTRREGKAVKAGTDEAAYEVAEKMFRDKNIADMPKAYE